MKHMLMATVAAVAAVALIGGTVQKASAWCKFNFGTGVNIGLETSGGTRTRGGYTRTSYPPPYAANNPAGYGAFAPAPVPAPGLVAPVPAVPGGASATPVGVGPVQSVGYYTYPSYNYTQPQVWWHGN